jgi:heptosyltransferase-2
MNLDLFNGVKDITIRMPNWVGDNVMVLPSFYKLKEVLRGKNIKIFCPANIFPLWKLASPDDEIITYKNTREAILRSKDKNLKSDLMFVLPNSFSSALAAYLTKSRARVGYGCNFRSFLLTHVLKKEKNFHQVDEYYYLIFQQKPKEVLVPCLKLEIEKDLDNNFVKSLGINKSKLSNCIAIAPGGAWGKAKRWFNEYYIDLIMKLLGLVEMIFIIGSKEEVEVYKDLESENRVKLICGSLSEIIYVLSMCSLAVGNDSGLMHLASAIGCKSVIIYGATDWRRTYPRDGRSYVFSSEMPCQPCWKRICPRSDYQCLKLVKPEYVWKLCLNLLKR